MNRKQFIQDSLKGVSVLALSPANWWSASDRADDFLQRLRPVGRILELEGYYVWCNAPIFGPDGKVHVFFSRWKAAKKMSGWIRGSEIAHAVADQPEGPYQVLGTVLEPRGGDYWDATTCHNPFISCFAGRYYLYYMGNSNGRTNTKRIGLASADSLYGPWTRTDQPLLLPGTEGSWDDHCTTNPSVIQHRDGRYWLYYKSWNTRDYEQQTGAVRGNRKYGVAFAGQPEGPFTKYNGNPIIDFSGHGDNAQLEDAFVWQEKKQFRMIARDMGYKDHQRGIIMHSRKGLHWSRPKTAFYPLRQYVDLPPAPAHLHKYGRLERPQLLLREGRPVYLFATSQGGRYETASPFIFKIV
ncbi:glycoside hydrolase family protein [Niabella terrae]